MGAASRAGFGVWTVAAVLACAPVSAQGPTGRESDDLLSRSESLLESLTGSRPATTGTTLSDADIGRGLKEALAIGTERVVGLLGRRDGFYARSDVRIPLPGTLGEVQDALGRFGMGALGEELELRLNRAAEAALPHTAKLFRNAIEEMSWQDVRRIYTGSQDSATRYFRNKMSTPLAAAMRPIVDRELADAGALRSYDRMIGEYKKLPFVPDAKTDLTNYVLERAMDGIFLYLGREEAAIRQRPAKRTTELLRRVFGQG